MITIKMDKKVDVQKLLSRIHSYIDQYSKENNLSESVLKIELRSLSYDNNQMNIELTKN